MQLEALAQVARADARRVQALQPGDGARDAGGAEPRLAGQVDVAGAEEAVLVETVEEIADDGQVLGWDQEPRLAEQTFQRRLAARHAVEGVGVGRGVRW